MHSSPDCASDNLGHPLEKSTADVLQGVAELASLLRLGNSTAARARLRTTGSAFVSWEMASPPIFPQPKTLCLTPQTLNPKRPAQRSRRGNIALHKTL